MKPSPKMKKVIEALAEKHQIDLSKKGAYFRLEMAGFDCLVVERVHSEKIVVAHYYEVNDLSIPEPDVVFYTGNAIGWVPISITQSLTGLRTYATVTGGTASELEISDPKGQNDLAEFTEQWAKNIESQGWQYNAQLTKACYVQYPEGLLCIKQEQLATRQTRTSSSLPKIGRAHV